MTRHIYLVIQTKNQDNPGKELLMTVAVQSREKRRLEKERRLRLKRLEEDIEAVNKAIAIAESGFNEVTDTSLTEALIFDRAALEARRSYLLRQVKDILSCQDEK